MYKMFDTSTTYSWKWPSHLVQFRLTGNNRCQHEDTCVYTVSFTEEPC